MVYLLFLKFKGRIYKFVLDSSKWALDRRACRQLNLFIVKKNVWEHFLPNLADFEHFQYISNLIWIGDAGVAILACGV